MFERYTEATKLLLFVSRQSAAADGSQAIEPRHLLHALLNAQDPLILSVLRDAQVSANCLLSVLPPIPRSPVDHRREIPFAGEMKRVLTFAADEADALKHAGVGTGHLLLGLVREEESAGGGPLMESGLSIGTTRAAVSREE